MGTLTVVKASDLPTLTETQLDATYAFLLGKHREALDENKSKIHRQIMLILGEWSRRLDLWLESQVKS